MNILAISFIRTLILYIVIMVSMRIMGKRQLSQLEPSELVVAVLISDLAANPLQDVSIPLLYGLIPVIALVCCEIIISGAVIKSVKLRALICGKPSIIVENGVINQKEMRKNRFTLDELSEVMREQGTMDISHIKYAILETDGSVSIILYPAESPVTPSQMNLTVEDNGYPVTIIDDGRVLSSNMRLKGLDEKWLKKELKKRNADTPKDVFFMTVDDTGKIYFVKKEKTS